MPKSETSKARPRILALHGPNFNWLGLRESEPDGRTTLADINDQLKARGRELGHEVITFQSNHEGALIDFLEEEAGSALGIIINPGSLTQTGCALAGALVATDRPVIEVHLTNIFARQQWPEEFHQPSVFSPICRGLIAGLGSRGYLYALEALLARS